VTTRILAAVINCTCDPSSRSYNPPRDVVVFGGVIIAGSTSSRREAMADLTRAVEVVARASRQDHTNRGMLDSRRALIHAAKWSADVLDVMRDPTGHSVLRSLVADHPWVGELASGMLSAALPPLGVRHDANASDRAAMLRSMLASASDEERAELRERIAEAAVVQTRITREATQP
jgi:hypothetical protein